jgi:hypothetical protein
MAPGRYLLVCAVLGSFPLVGQEAATDAPKVPATAQGLPPAPPHRPPINFRQLLAMTVAEREKVLATRSEKQREVLHQKLREYDALPPIEREARLCSLELRLYLRPLLDIAVSNRVQQLETVPQQARGLMEARLQFWDQLPREVQKEFLQNEWLLRYIFRPETEFPSTPKLAESVRIRIERGIQSWNGMPTPKRQEILGNFQRLFELSEEERGKILGEFTDAERQRMRRTLQRFEQLPAAQRQRCLDGFAKFAGLSPRERERFLTNVELWESMSAKDRQAWQAMVARMATPKPPGVPGLNAPPLLPAPKPPQKTEVAVTNAP